MPGAPFQVPKGTKLEIVYTTKDTTKFVVEFVPDSGSDGIMLISDLGDGSNGPLVPYLLLTSAGSIKVTSDGIVINTASGSTVPTSTVTLSACPYFMCKRVLAGGGTLTEVIQIAVT